MGKDKRKDRRKDNEKESQSLGRPATRVLKLDATPEEVARRIFANAKPPDPNKQKPSK